MSNLSKKSFAQPDELKTPPKTNAAVVKLGKHSQVARVHKLLALTTTSTKSVLSPLSLVAQ